MGVFKGKKSTTDKSRSRIEKGRSFSSQHLYDKKLKSELPDDKYRELDAFRMELSKRVAKSKTETKGEDLDSALDGLNINTSAHLAKTLGGRSCKCMKGRKSRKSRKSRKIGRRKRTTRRRK